jgi:hypothetical protein
MSSRAVLPLLLLITACSVPATPAPDNPPEDRRAFWQEQTRMIPSSWGRKKVDAYLDGIRVSVPHRPAFINGGGFTEDSQPMTYFDLYSLDGVYDLYLSWNEQEVPKGIRSAEVVSFQDLKKRIDPELWEAVWAIQRSPSAQNGLNFNPVLLLRAVNALHPLGKEQALKALWAYDRLAHDLSSVDRRKYHVDEYRILPIVHLLFESPIGSKPGFVLGAGDVAPPKGEAWPLFPIVLVQDVPFMMVSGYVLSGIPQQAADHLRRDLGPLRSAPLSPKGTALEAADELTESEAWKALRLGPGNEGRKKWQIRRQALGALSAVFTPRPEESSNDCCVDPTEAQWRATVARASSSGLLWSPEVQDFILGR